MTFNPTRGSFIKLPYLVDDSDLDPYQVRLYLHYQRVCWMRGVASETVRETAKFCRMSRGKTLAAQKALACKGWIKLRIVGPAGHQQTFVEMAQERWDENDQRYASGSPAGRKPGDADLRPGQGPERPGGGRAVHQPDAPVHDPDASVRVEGQCGSPPGRSERDSLRRERERDGDLVSEGEGRAGARDEQAEHGRDGGHQLALTPAVPVGVGSPPGRSAAASHRRCEICGDGLGTDHPPGLAACFPCARGVRPASVRRAVS